MVDILTDFHGFGQSSISRLSWFYFRYSNVHMLVRRIGIILCIFSHGPFRFCFCHKIYHISYLIFDQRFVVNFFSVHVCISLGDFYYMHLILYQVHHRVNSNYSILMFHYDVIQIICGAIKQVFVMVLN